MILQYIDVLLSRIEKVTAMFGSVGVGNSIKTWKEDIVRNIAQLKRLFREWITVQNWRALVVIKSS